MLEMTTNGAGAADDPIRSSPSTTAGSRTLASRRFPGSRLEIFDGVGHLPQPEAPGRFITVSSDFIAENQPARFDSKQWRGRLRDASDEP